MDWIIPAISIDCGIKFAISLILFVRYFETKEKMIFWWGLAWFFFGCHALVELLIIETGNESLWFIRHIFYASVAVAFLESITHMCRPVLKKWHIAAVIMALCIIISSYAGVFVFKNWLAAALPVSLFSGAGFIACGFYFLKICREKKSTACWLILFGFFLNGIHNMDYPFLRPLEWFAPIGFTMGVLFSVIFAAGLIAMSTEELKKQRDESDRKVSGQAALGAVFKQVSRSLNLQEILDDALDRILEVIKVNNGCIFLLDKEKREINLRVCRGFDAEYTKIIACQKLNAKSIYTEVAQTKKPIIIANIAEYPQFRDSLIKKDTRSFACIPLVSKSKVMGVLSLSSKSYYQLVPEELQLLNSIGDAIGVAIENAKLYQAVKNWNEELEKIVEERTKDLSNTRKATLNVLEDINEAYKELKEAQVKLVQRERLAAIGQMSAVIGHELRNPLTGIKMATYCLNQRSSKASPEFVKMLQDIEKEVDKASTIISNMLDFSQPFKLTLSPVNINVLLEDVIKSAGIKEWLDGVEVIKDFHFSGLQVLLDAFRFRQALDNIILNAHQAMPTGGKLTVSTKKANRDLEIRISDTGIGIEQESLKKILEPFFTMKHKGVGLGLALAREVVEGHNGSINVESKVNKGSSFIIRLPINEEN